MRIRVTPEVAEDTRRSQGAEPAPATFLGTEEEGATEKSTLESGKGRTHGATLLPNNALTQSSLNPHFPGKPTQESKLLGEVLNPHVRQERKRNLTLFSTVLILQRDRVRTRNRAAVQGSAGQADQ